MTTTAKLSIENKEGVYFLHLCPNFVGLTAASSVLLLENFSTMTMTVKLSMENKDHVYFLGGGR